MAEVFCQGVVSFVFLKIMKCRSCFQRVAGVLVHFDMRNRRISGSDETLGKSSRSSKQVYECI